VTGHLPRPADGRPAILLTYQEGKAFERKVFMLS